MREVTSRKRLEEAVSDLSMLTGRSLEVDSLSYDKRTRLYKVTAAYRDPFGARRYRLGELYRMVMFAIDAFEVAKEARR